MTTARTICLLIAAAATALVLGGTGASANSPASTATVQVMVDQTARPVPDSFLGLSAEPTELPSFERNPAFGRLLDQLAVPGGGRLILRVGGRSADNAYWPTPGVHSQRSAYALTPDWLASLASLVSSAKLQVMLNLNLAANSPQMAARFAAAATHALPRGAISALEIGNEPDLYGYGPHASIRGYTLASYVKQYSRYARALAAQRVALAGPSLNRATPAWINAALSAGPGTLRVVTAHSYPYWAGYTPGSPGYASIAGLLSDKSTVAPAAALDPVVAMTHGAKRAFRITEMGTSAGKVPGVTDTFATALWAPDALLSMASVGVDGVNVHIRARYSNSALSANGPPRPLFYGLVLTARALGPAAALLPARVTQSGGASLKAWAVRVRGNGLHLLLINRGKSPVTVSVPLAASGSASVQQLLAPSAGARTGETLAGQSLTASGTWQGTRTELTVPLRAGGYTVTLPARSAALLTTTLSAS